ncbi:MAG TPA: asparagine synthase (glutamine-hydrolyzing) [Pseudomonadota bacterium]|nr:asparagine synthase (glutamine-hydrolyzing) [Pseudomonadota bacterium]
MCGLGGYLGEPARPRPLRAEALTLHHRGPDDQQVLHFAAADGTPGLLAFARLSILDLSPRGAQPMQSDDGAHALIYNGEIYNHAALRAELVAAGASFRSRSDTEVVLRAYGALGVQAFARLRGMFALALWDASRQELLLARDTLGIKPLYYCFDGERLVFASEVRALLAAGAVLPRLEPRAVPGLLSSGTIPEPLTILRDVAALPPGHLLRVAVGRGRLSAPTLERFPPAPRWAPSQGASVAPAGRLFSSPALREKAGELAPLLRETVGLHLVADVPVALLLSGGVDSTAVAALARAAAPAAQLGSFTLTYGAADPHSEGAAARRTAEALQLAHHDCHLTAAAALAALPRFLAAQDQPSIDGFNTYLISEQVRAAGYKVALSGLGGDELFLGYRLHHLFAAAWLLGDKLPGATGRLAAVAERLASLCSPPPGHPSPAGRCTSQPHPFARPGDRTRTSPASESGVGRQLLHRLLGRSATAAARLSKVAAVLDAAALPPDERAAALYSRLRSLWSPAEVAELTAPGPAASSTDKLPAELNSEGREAGSLGASSACATPTEPSADAEPGEPPRCDRSLRAQLRRAYQRVMQLERRGYLRNTLLRDADVLSMAHGVELRVPLCDAELWRAVEELGPEPTLHTKELLVAATSEPLCTAAAARRKRGFTLPLHRFLTGALHPLVSAHFADAALVRRAGLTAAATRAWTEYTQAPTERMTYRVWSLFTLLAYVKRHGLEL